MELSHGGDDGEEEPRFPGSEKLDTLRKTTIWALPKEREGFRNAQEMASKLLLAMALDANSTAPSFPISECYTRRNRACSAGWACLG